MSMSTLNAVKPLCLPVLPHATAVGGAALIPAIYLGRKALPLLFQHQKPPRSTRIKAFNPPQNFPSLSLRSPKPHLRNIRVSSYSSLGSLPLDSLISPTNPTLTIAAFFSIAVSITNQLIHAITSFIASNAPNPSLFVPTLAQFLNESLSSSATKVLSALVNQYYYSYPVTTPLTIVVLAMSKCLDFFYVMVAIRVQLSLFDLPWNRQPFSTIRAVTDPYLHFFQKLAPPIEIPPNHLIDISPICAVTLLDVLTMMLTVRTP